MRPRFRGRIYIKFILFINCLRLSLFGVMTRLYCPFIYCGKVPYPDITGVVVVIIAA